MKGENKKIKKRWYGTVTSLMNNLRTFQMILNNLFDITRPVSQQNQHLNVLISYSIITQVITENPLW